MGGVALVPSRSLDSVGITAFDRAFEQDVYWRPREYA
jgi:hypothetical protein